MTTRMYWIHALTPLHVGAGRGVGFIDLPIMREKVTNWPLVPGSAVKGVIADHFGATDNARTLNGNEILKAAFGTSGDDNSNSGALVFTDARIVCLPIRSLYGTFAWVTCPMVLKRLSRDLEATGGGTLPVVCEIQKEQVCCTTDTCLAAGQNNNRRVYLEDLDLTPIGNAQDIANSLAPHFFSGTWIDEFKKRLAIAHDDVFNFLSEAGTEVNARVCIDENKKTVKKGALWYEESLPAEVILAGLACCDKVYSKETTVDGIMNQFCNGERILQIGGHSTTGKGRVRCVFTPNAVPQGGGQ